MALRFMRYTACFCLMVLLTACASTGNEISKEKLNENIKIGDKFSYSGDIEYGERWWEVFKNSELNSLMEQMFENNYNIAGSYEGLKALQAALGISRADRLPSVDAGAQAGERYSTDNTGNREWRENYELSLTASYEADIWGRIKAATESDKLSLVSGTYDMQSLYMTLTAELADRYFIYKSMASVLKMQREMLALRQKQISSLEMMYSSGIGSLDTIYTYQTNIADLMESMTETRQSMGDAKLQMALLMGYNDASMVNISDKYSLGIPFLPKVIPSQVAEKRPDIRSAYALVLKADRNVAEAMANRYPKLSFSASAAYSGDEISKLVSPENFVANLVANLTMPLFDAGRLSSQQKQQEFLYKKEVYSYYQTVLEALNEVSKSLEDNMQNEQALLLSEQKVSIEEKRLKVSKMKYEMGILNYSDVIDDQIGLLSAWLTEVNARRSLISSRIELARSTGGSWTDEEIEKRLSSSQETR